MVSNVANWYKRTILQLSYEYHSCEFTQSEIDSIGIKLAINLYATQTLNSDEYSIFSMIS